MSAAARLHRNINMKCNTHKQKSQSTKETQQTTSATTAKAQLLPQVPPTMVPLALKAPCNTQSLPLRGHLHLVPECKNLQQIIIMAIIMYIFLQHHTHVKFRGRKSHRLYRKPSTELTKNAGLYNNGYISSCGRYRD